MIAEAIEKIQKMVNIPFVKEINGKHYLIDGFKYVEIRPDIKTQVIYPALLELKSLDAFADYLMSSIDPNIKSSACYVLVNNYTVQVLSIPDINGVRIEFVRTSVTALDSGSSAFSLESASEYLLRNFVAGLGDYADVANLLSSVTDVREVLTEDNGVATEVIIKTSLVMKKAIKVKPFYELTPVDSFPEVIANLPLRRYIVKFRSEKTGSGEISVRFRDISDDVYWQIRRKTIKKYLDDRFGSVFMVIC